jgi:hypothetical protein
MQSALRTPKRSVIPALSTADKIIASLEAEESEIDAKTRQIDPEIVDLEGRLKVGREVLKSRLKERVRVTLQNSWREGRF